MNTIPAFLAELMTTDYVIGQILGAVLGTAIGISIVILCCSRKS